MSRFTRRWIPPQHGAWAMLVLPWLVGVLTSSWRWPQLPLLVAWVAGYLWSYFALLAVKTGRWQRYRRQLLVYGCVAAVLAMLVLVARPIAIVFAPWFAVLGLVSVWFARRHDDRNLLNDVALIGQAAAMVPLALLIGDGSLTSNVWVATAAVFGYFVGTAFYVKTMIRERGSIPAYRRSVGFHVLALVVAGLLAWPLAIPFAWYLIRAAWFPKLAMTPKQVGLIELAGSLALLATLTLTR